MKKWTIPSIIILSLIIFGISIRGGRGIALDYIFIEAVQNLVSAKWNWPYFITTIGNVSTYFAIYPIVLAYCYLKKDYRLLITLLMATLISNLLVEVFKHIFIRIRPENFMRITQGGFSFPSGHASVSSATLWTLARIMRIQTNRDKYLRYLAIFLPFLIGLTRIILGVHWPTDIIAGLLLGYAVSSITPDLSKRLKNRLKLKQYKII